MKLAADRLLTPELLAKLNRTVLLSIPTPGINKLKASVPPAVQAVLEAENSVHQMLAPLGASVVEMERVAVLSEVAGLGPNSKELPSGQWSLHPLLWALSS